MLGHQHTVFAGVVVIGAVGTVGAVAAVGGNIQNLLAGDINQTTSQDKRGSNLVIVGIPDFRLERG